jgi:hypothetical protein
MSEEKKGAEQAPSNPASSHLHATLRERVKGIAKAHPWIESLGLDLLVVYGIPYAAEKIAKVLDKRFQHNQGKVANAQCFGEALSMLANDDETFADFELLVDFMSSGLTNERQRDEFIINCAMVGEHVEETKVFLLSLARLQDPGDHSARVEYLKNLTFIDKKGQVRKFWEVTKTAAGNVADNVMNKVVVPAVTIASIVITKDVITPIKSGLDQLEKAAAKPNNSGAAFRARMRQRRGKRVVKCFC